MRRKVARGRISLPCKWGGSSASRGGGADGESRGYGVDLHPLGVCVEGVVSSVDGDVGEWDGLG